MNFSEDKETMFGVTTGLLIVQLFECSCGLLNTCTDCKSFHDAAQVVADTVRYKDTAERQVGVHVHAIRYTISIKLHSLHSTFAYKSWGVESEPPVPESCSVDTWL